MEFALVVALGALSSLLLISWLALIVMPILALAIGAIAVLVMNHAPHVKVISVAEGSWSKPSEAARILPSAESSAENWQREIGAREDFRK